MLDTPFVGIIVLRRDNGFHEKSNIKEAFASSDILFFLEKIQRF
jgi:hypothetical protein